MSTTRIFDETVNGRTFEVWLTNGLLQFVVDGVIRHDIGSVQAFLIEAAKEINRPNSTDGAIAEAVGSISDRAVENFEGGDGVALDTGGFNPSISLQDDGTEVVISGNGVGGSLRIDFGTGSTAQSEATLFKAFADDLLGKATTTPVETLTGIKIGDFTRTVTVSTRDDDIRQINFRSTGVNFDKFWADIYVDDLAESFGGTKERNGNVTETSFTASQSRLAGENNEKVDLGSQGVGGKEVWVFANETAATGFLNAVKADFGSPANRGVIINEAIEIIAEDLGGTQLRNGNVSVNYEARQIRLTGADNDIVDLGNHGVGGKEQYQFADQKTAQKFIDLVRDAVGVKAQEGRLVDEFVFKVSGGQGISGSPTFVGKDAFVEYIAEEFGGTMLRNGFVGESFDGGATKIGDGSDVQLAKKFVGGTEIWDFADEATADAFIKTLDDIFG